MNKMQARYEVNLMINEYLSSGGKIKQGRARKVAPRFMKSMHVASKKMTYGRSYDKPSGYKKVDYEFVGNNACGYSTKYVMD